MRDAIGTTGSASRRARRAVLAALAALLFAGLLQADAAAPPVAPPAPAVEIAIYAAASLRNVLQELEPACERATGTHLVFNFGSSGELGRQIAAANKADIFFSADVVTMDEVAKAGLVDASSRRTPLSNRLVVIAPSDSRLAVTAAAEMAGPGVKRLSFADPASVPAGRYAKAWLEKAGVWDSVKERIAPAVDVRAALAAVEAGGAQLGVVYKTDAAISKRVRVLYEVPEADGPRIEYVLAALNNRPHLEASRRVAAWLASAAAAEAFRRYGFVTLAPSP